MRDAHGAGVVLQRCCPGTPWGSCLVPRGTDAIPTMSPMETVPASTLGYTAADVARSNFPVDAQSRSLDPGDAVNGRGEWGGRFHPEDAADGASAWQCRVVCHHCRSSVAASAVNGRWH